MDFGLSYTIVILFIALVVIIALWYLLKQKADVFFKGSYLDRFSRDLTEMARKGEIGPIVGRKEEIKRTIRTLSRKDKDNIILIGKAGVGKTAVVEGLAMAIVKRKVPPILYSKRVLALNLAALVAGTKYRGEFENRIIRTIDEIVASQRQIILFIDEIHILSSAGQAEGAIGAGDILKPHLARGAIQLIGATTPVEYEKYIKQDPTLERRLHPILISEATKEETLEILRGIKGKFERHHKIEITDDALKACVDFSEEYLPGRNYPDKAIDLLDEAASDLRMRYSMEKSMESSPVLRESDIEKIATEQKRDLESF